MGFAGEFYSSIIEHVSGSDAAETIKKIWNALDPGKWGSPLTEGEAHYVNDVVVKQFYKPEGQKQEDRNAVTLAEVYDDLEDDFAYLRRGWLADYMGDAFAQNAFQKMLFIIATRTGEFGRSLVESIETADRSPGSPSGTEGKVWAVIWATFFFHFATLTFAEVTGFTSLMELWIIWPTLLGLYVCYVKWYGRYGMYLPVFGTQSVPSALATVVLLVTTIRVIVEFADFIFPDWIPLLSEISMGMFPQFFHPTQISLPLIGNMFGYLIYLGLVAYVAVQAYNILRIAFVPILVFAPITFPVIYSAWVFVEGVLQTLQIPQPIFLGLYPMINNMEWGSLLAIWGLAGLANIFYGEWVENQTREAEEIHAFKRILDEKLAHFKGGGS